MHHVKEKIIIGVIYYAENITKTFDPVNCSNNILITLEIGI